MTELLSHPTELHLPRGVPEAFRHQVTFEQLSIDPILNAELPGIGDTALHDVRWTGGKNGEPRRAHQLFTTELDGFRHAYELTDPADGEPPSFVIASFPGFTEHIEGGIRQDLHAELAKAFPDARIISFATDGIGTTGDRFSKEDRFDHGLQQMGIRRHRLLEALADTLPITVIGTSMGTVIAQHLNAYNLALPPEERLDVIAQVRLAQALVAPENVPKDMALRFLPGLAKNLLKHTVRSKPKQIGHLAVRAFNHGFKSGDSSPLLFQLTELLKGTPEDEVERVISQLPTIDIGGGQDPLKQAVAQQKLQSNPATRDNIIVKEITSKGHEITIDATKVVKTILKYAGPIIRRQLDLRLNDVA